MIVYAVVAIEEIYCHEYERYLSFFYNELSAKNHLSILEETITDKPYGGYIIKEVKIQ